MASPWQYVGKEYTERDSMNISSPPAARTRNFRKRLEIEREVLRSVNAVTIGAQLSGLTKGAIELWSNSISDTSYPFDRAEIVSLLMTIARVTGTISDNSRAIVSDDEVPASREILIEELKRKLNS